MPTELPSDSSSDSNILALASQEDIYIFDLLLQDRGASEWEHLVAMITYAQYTRSKHEFIRSYFEEHNVMPSDGEMKAIIFLFKNINNNALNNLRLNSQSLLQQVLEKHSRKMLSQNISSPVEKIVKENTRFWVAVQASMVASFFYSLLIALILFIATATLPNTKFSRAIKILFEVEQTNDEEATKE
ncbi:MAG: hypothetical protein AAGG51_03935 [Cyanobacteria bacterium P01_G01_bin.54]